MSEDPMKKPTWFNWYDFLSIGGLGVACLSILIYTLTAGIESANAKQGYLLLGVVCAVFLGIYGVWCWRRKKDFDKFTWYPTYGFMVCSDGTYPLPTPEALDRVVKKTLDAWAPYHPAQSIIMTEANWCWFKSDLNTKTDEVGFLCKGYTVPNSHQFKVDYDTPADPLESTAFAHELGHVIRGNATGNWDGPEHHQFMKEHGLP
jgi:hypothetical protein